MNAQVLREKVRPLIMNYQATLPVATYGQPASNILHHGPLKTHESHFHIDLRPLARVTIPDSPQNLLSGGSAANQAAPTASDALVANAQSLLDQVKSDLNLTPGEIIMAIPDMPNVPPQNVPVMIAQANQAQAGNATTVRTIGVCATAPNQGYSGENGLAPVADVSFYLRQYENRTVTGPATTTILQQPKHGVLRLVTEADGNSFGYGKFDPADPGYVYLPESGYVGKDSASILVDFGSVKVTVKYFFHAVSGPVGDNWIQEYCAPKGMYWKISSTLDANGTSTLTSVEQVPSVASE